jgi:hypothetical protein
MYYLLQVVLSKCVIRLPIGPWETTNDDFQGLLYDVMCFALLSLTQNGED